MQARESSFIKQKLLFLEGTKNCTFKLKRWSLPQKEGKIILEIVENEEKIPPKKIAFCSFFTKSNL